MVRFQHSISTNVDFKLNELDDCYQIVLHHHTKDPINASIDASIATLFRMCRITFGPELKPERVLIAHPKPVSYKTFDEFFSVNVEFDAPETQLFFSKNTFEMQLSSANPDLARMNAQIVIEYLKYFDKESLSMQVRTRNIEELNNGVHIRKKLLLL